jgi:predicted ABC-type ATPase
MNVVAGPNGSGKTFITSELLIHQWMANCVYINPDEIAQHQFGDWNSPEAVLKAAKQAQSLREDCLTQGKNFAFETVLSSPDKVEFLRQGAAHNFFIRLFFVATSSPTINAARIALRVMTGGHDVPISKVISRYTKSIANCETCASFVDRAYIYDNSVDNEMPRLLFRAKNGKIEKTYGRNIPEWAASIKGALEPLKKRSGPKM